MVQEKTTGLNPAVTSPACSWSHHVANGKQRESFSRTEMGIAFETGGSGS